MELTTTSAHLLGGRYRLVGLLGEGGMARVFDAFDERLERAVAVKVLRPETCAVPGMRQRFQQEAHIAAKLVHPNIVAVLDYGEQSSSPYLVMERLSGTTFRDEIVGPVPAPRVRRVMAETLSGLAAAHRFGILHRDIKPSNILVQDDGSTKISDFGIAKSFDIRTARSIERDDTTQTGMVLGTPGYLAPERRMGHPATIQSDLYSVGAVMVEALTGTRLHNPSTALRHLPPGLRAVAASSLAPEPVDRYSSAAAMWHALQLSDRVTSPSPPAQAPGAPTRAAPRKVASNRTPAPEAPAPGRCGESPSRSLTARGPEDRRRPRFLLAGLGGLMAGVVALAVVLTSVPERVQPGTQAAAQHTTQAAVSPPADTVGAAIRELAQELSSGDLPVDNTLAGALDATADAPPGPSRQASAQQDMSLAQSLAQAGEISTRQYDDTLAILAETGATVPTTTTTTTTAPPPTTPTAPATMPTTSPPTTGPDTAPSLPGGLFDSRGHDHGEGDGFGHDGGGDQGGDDPG